MARSASNRAAAVLKSAIASFLLAFLFYPARAAGAFDSLAALAAAPETGSFLSPLPQPEPPEATMLRPAPGLSVYFVDVGQGDAIYLEFPDGGNALIDGGPSSSASAPLALFLRQRGISHIDHVMLTHPHADHFRGLQHVFANYTVGTFYDTRVDNTGAVGDETVRVMAAELGVPSVYPAPGDTLNWSSAAEIKVLNACHEPLASKNSEVVNNCSIVMRLTSGGGSVLFTGDAGEKVEAGLVKKFGERLRSDVLKVGHHGSRHSSTTAFLNAVRPSYSYIPVGKNNYGHPHAEVLERLTVAGTGVVRADLSGTQEFLLGRPHNLLAYAE